MIGSILACVSLAAACGAPRGGGQVPECTSREGNLVAGTRVTTLAGEYQLMVVATEGARATTSETGRLTLLAHDGEARQIRQPDGTPDPNVQIPLYGTANLDLEAVGAVRIGDLESSDPMQPGVAVLEQRSTDSDSPPTITLRFGSLANQRDITRFDGGYMALRVSWIESGAFGGTWESGVRSQTAGGYFCAFQR